MKIRDIPYITRLNGFFRWRNRKIPAIHKGDGVGVALHLERSQVDEDFELPLKEGLLFLSLEEWKDLAVHFKKSDVATMRLLKHGWKGKLPFTEKDVCDIVLIMIDKCPKFGPMLARRVENKSRNLHRLLKEINNAKEKLRP